MLRSSLLLLLCYTGLANAELTGVSFNIADYDSDWDFENDIREAQISEISLRFEDSIKSGLTIGGTLGYMDMRVIADSDSAAETLKFDGGFVSLHLHQPFRISDSISFYGAFGISYYNGSESGGGSDGADIDWTQAVIEFGLGLRFGSLRIIPYAAYHDIDGDISDDGTVVFEMDDAIVRGLRFDYFIDEGGFLRFEIVGGGSQGGYLSFVRRY